MARRTDPQKVYEELREAIRDEVYAEVHEATRPMRIKQNVLYGILAALIAVSVWYGVDQRQRLEDTIAAQARADEKREAQTRERRDQICKGDERDHLEEVIDLRDKYEALLTPGLLRGDIRTLVIRGLPKLERAASKDRAADFCDRPGVGLPEPDPVVPERPEGLR